MAKKQKSWEKRLCGSPAKQTIDFVESLSIDRRLYKYDIAGSIAHARMLSEQGLIGKGDFRKIKKGLIEIDTEIDEGKFRFNKTFEDIHMAIEAALVAKIGEAGKKLHTARSRNDQVATDVRLWTRDAINKLQTSITNLQKVFVELASSCAGDVMPAYTHLQRAQPVVIGAYLLSFVEQFERDRIRLGNCYNLLDVSPLGSGATAGTTLGIDRADTAEQLGFASVSRSSIDSVSDRDFCAEFIFDCSLIAAHLSRLAEDLIIYSTNEFGFIRVNDSYCTSSSMMPQKRNPDLLELIRGKTGRVYGALTGMLTILKAQPGGYNRDMQEDKVHLFEAFDTAGSCLDMAAAILTHTTFNTEKISEGLEEGYLDATSLAEYLVTKGVAFRDAHGIVGSLVAQCEKQGRKLAELSVAEFKKCCSAIGRDVYKSLGAANVASRYKSSGAGGSREVKKQIRFWQSRLSKR